MAPQLPPAAAADTQARRTRPVLGAPIDAINTGAAVARIAQWAARRESRFVCVCNAHSVVTAARDPAFMRAIIAADMATPDGEPVAWMLRRQGVPKQRRVSGPELMWAYCEYAAVSGEALFLLGSTPSTLAALQQRLQHQWPGLHIAGAISPPFGVLSREDDAAIVSQINASGAATLWVGLGCPKQELWMAAHCGRVQAVMVGVGAAFDFHAGTVQRAPVWMREHGLEWLHRLLIEPRRLARRYLGTNLAFMLGAARQLFAARRAPHSGPP